MVLKNLFTGQQWRNRHGEQTYEHGWEGRRERVRCMERVTWKFTVPNVKYTANGNSLYDPAIPLLGIYPEENKFEKDTCIPLFIAALFTIARTWKQPRCP